MKSRATKTVRSFSKKWGLAIVCVRRSHRNRIVHEQSRANQKLFVFSKTFIRMLQKKIFRQAHIRVVVVASSHQQPWVEVSNAAQRHHIASRHHVYTMSRKSLRAHSSHGALTCRRATLSPLFAASAMCVCVGVNVLGRDGPLLHRRAPCVRRQRTRIHGVQALFMSLTLVLCHECIGLPYGFTRGCG
jgi:hypothetical protein